MVQAVIQWEKHEKMNNLYVKRMQSVPCSLYSQEGVQLPKLGVNFTKIGGAATASLFYSVPETLRKLSLTTVHHNMSWKKNELSHPRHRLIKNFNTRHVFSMQKGQKIIVVKMLQDKKVCIDRDKQSDDVFLNNEMRKSLYVGL